MVVVEDQNIYNQGLLFRRPEAAGDPAMVRLRTGQVLRALRAATAAGGVAPRREPGLSGQILEAHDTAGDDARLVCDRPATGPGAGR